MNIEFDYPLNTAGDFYVTCDVDPKGYVTDLKVWFRGADITEVITDRELLRIEGLARSRAETARDERQDRLEDESA